MIKNAKIVSIGRDSDEYHAAKGKRGTPECVMSFSSLVMFASCPRRYIRGYELPESDARKFGTLLDGMLLMPQDFDKRFAVAPKEYENDDGEMKPWRSNAKACKAWLAEHDGMTIVKTLEYENAKAAIERLEEDETIAAYIADSDKQVELTGEWHDPATGLVIPITALLDMVPRKGTEFEDTLGDLKTTRSAGLLAWQRWAFQCGYHIQAALYTDLYTGATGEDRNTFCYILVENFAPWETGKRMAGQDRGDGQPGFVTLGREEYKRLLANYCQCLKHNRWPSYDDTDESVQGWGILRVDPFQAERAAFAPKYDFEEPAEETEQEPDEIIP